MTYYVLSHIDSHIDLLVARVRGLSEQLAIAEALDEPDGAPFDALVERHTAACEELIVAKCRTIEAVQAKTRCLLALAVAGHFDGQKVLVPLLASLIEEGRP